MTTSKSKSDIWGLLVWEAAPPLATIVQEMLKRESRLGGAASVYDNYARSLCRRYVPAVPKSRDKICAGCRLRLNHGATVVTPLAQGKHLL